MKSHEYVIKTSWDARAITDHEHVKVTLAVSESDPNSLVIKVWAPFYNASPVPSQTPGEFFDLWEYEG
jgi:hypothetical protein